MQALSKVGKSMLIYNILTTNLSKLKFLGKTEENVDIIQRCLTEFKKHSVSVADLENEIESVTDKYLKIKLKDISLIYTKFQEKIKDKFIEETELLSILSQNLENTDIFTDSYVFIDEFLGFTKQEYEIIMKIAKQAKSVSITLALDNLAQDSNPDLDVYFSSKETLRKILNHASQSEIKIDEYIYLEQVHRFKNKELKHLNLAIEKNTVQKYVETVENINLFLAKNRYSEIENVASKIYELTKNSNYRYKEIAVISQQIDAYSSNVRSVFSRYNIPVFIDEKRDLNQNIIVKYVLSILEIISSNFGNQSIFNHLKLGMNDLDEDEVFELENYVTKWGINRQKWLKEFTIEKEKKKEKIERLEEIRKEIIIQLFELKSNMNNNKTARRITEELYSYMIRDNIEQKIAKKIEDLTSENLVDIANEYEESYKIIVGILEEIVDIFGGEKISYDKFIKILKNGLNASGLGKIPGTQDQVIFGDVERTRSNKIKVLFIIGINDGNFPSVNKNEGFLNDADREKLKKDGMEIAKGTMENIYDEKYNIYKTFSIAEEKVFLSYSTADNLGGSLRPSVLINKIKKTFPTLKEKSDIIEKEHCIANKEITYEYLLDKIANIKEENDLESLEDIWKDVYFYYKNDDVWSSKLEQDFRALRYTNKPDVIDEKLIDKLYGKTVNTSVSKLEQFRKCEFSYYLKYGLDLKPREEVKVYSFDTGTFMHNILDGFFVKIKEDEIKLEELEEEQIENIVTKIIEEELKEAHKYIFTQTVKYRILVQRLKKVILRAVKYIVLSLVESRFSLEGTEVEFGTNKKYDPIVIKMDNGKEIKINGIVDRVDTSENEDGKYIRIIDYKSSSQSINFNSLYAGIQIQLVTYLNAINNKENLIPAGIYYFSLIEKLLKIDSQITEEEIEAKLRDEYKMKGIILADVNVIKMQDTNVDVGKTSKILQAAIKKDGEIQKNKTKTGISEEEFELIQKYTDDTIKEISKEILKGKIDINPYYNKKSTPCDYCEYKSICRFDPQNRDNKYNIISNLEKEEIFEKMRQKLEK